MIKITNDTSTLQGSLYECKDQLISELANQGVTATYDPTTGLLGLIHKISEIDTGGTLTLTTNKSILSYYDSETATLTATHSQGAGKTVEIYNAVTGTKIGDATDNNDGTYTYTYNSAGIGDISMTAVSGQTESNSITIEDCYYFNDGSTTNGLEIGSNVSCTSNGNYITITTSTTGEKYVKLPVTLTNSQNWEYSIEIGAIGTSQSIAVNLMNTDRWAGHSDLSHTWFLHNTNVLIQNVQVGNVVKFSKNGTTMTMNLNGSDIDSQTWTFNSTYQIGFYTNNGRTQNVKNIKLKPLPTTS